MSEKATKEALVTEGSERIVFKYRELRFLFQLSFFHYVYGEALSAGSCKRLGMLEAVFKCFVARRQSWVLGRRAKQAAVTETRVRRLFLCFLGVPFLSFLTFFCS